MVTFIPSAAIVLKVFNNFGERSILKTSLKPSEKEIVALRRDFKDEMHHLHAVTSSTHNVITSKCDSMFATQIALKLRKAFIVCQ
jgi:hypothetical protein